MRHFIKIITQQGYPKIRIYAMGAVINDRKCKKLRDSQEKYEELFLKLLGLSLFYKQ
jgi:hypothetical protein